MRKFASIAVLLLCAVFLIAAAPSADPAPAPIRTAKQLALHEAAELLRAAGYEDEDAPIVALSEEWFQQQHDLDIIAKVIDGEAPYCPREHQIAVGAVVLNRVEDERFPGTVEEVVGQTSVINGRLVAQYSPTYCYGFSGILRTSYEAAAAAMNGEHDVPADVVWQANFPQGREAWWISEVNTGGFSSTTWFCR